MQQATSGMFDTVNCQRKCQELFTYCVHLQLYHFALIILLALTYIGQV